MWPGSPRQEVTLCSVAREVIQGVTLCSVAREPKAGGDPV